MNIALLVGKYAGITKKLGISSADDYFKLKLKVKRDFKNEHGEYESDIYTILLSSSFSGVLECSNLDENTTLSVTGRLSLDYKGKLQVIAKKIQILGWC